MNMKLSIEDTFDVKLPNDAYDTLDRRGQIIGLFH